jgi:integrase
VTGKKRANTEGSIYRRKDGMYLAYVWVTTPEGVRRRKYISGAKRSEVHAEWIKLQREASRHRIPTRVPTVGEYLNYWMREVVGPTLKPKTADTYAMHIRLYIEPALGKKRLDRLSVQGIRQWLNQLASECQCCAQGKDAARPPRQQRCCAMGECCQQRLSRRTVADIRSVLRSALNTAMSEDVIATNPTLAIKLPRDRGRQMKPWSVEEAKQFLESARRDGDPMYAGYVLILVLGLRRGEVLGLTWPKVDLTGREVEISRGLQRIRGELVNGETKTVGSDATLPIPEICATALRLQQQAQKTAALEAGRFWVDTGHVLTTSEGSPVDPRNFYRSFQNRCRKAGVRPIPVHGTRHTCGSLLAALDVHPRVAMQILRHSKIDVTMEIYTHIPSELTRQALHRLGDQLGHWPESGPQL